MTTIGVVGLGNMGRGMALSLKRGGFRVLGTDTVAATREALAGEGIETFDSIAPLCAQADILILSLPNAAIVEHVVCGEGGLLAHARAGLIVVDTSTSHPDVTHKLNTLLAEKGIVMIDAPVSGGPKGAITGTMTMVMGGEEADIAKVEPVLAAMSAKRVHIGASGAGHVAKIINNMLCAAHLLTGAEAVRLAREAGVDPERMLEGLNAGSGRSGVTMVNFPTWVLNNAFNSGFTMKLMRKDVRLGAQFAEELGLSLPFAKLTAEIWAESEETIPDGEDFNRIVELQLGHAE